jgi:hypothetical protein
MSKLDMMDGLIGYFLAIYLIISAGNQLSKNKIWLPLFLMLGAACWFFNTTLHLIKIVVK